MTKMICGLLLTTAATACEQSRLMTRPEDCLGGCYTKAGACVAGISETACGSGGLACSECALTDACVEKACHPQAFVENERITWGPHFASVGSKALPAEVSRLTTLQPENDQRVGATPVVYGLRPASRDLVSLGTWDGLGATVTRVSSAVGPADETAQSLTFLDVFAGNRRLLMTGYAVGSVHRLFLFSTDAAQRPVGRTTENVAGPFAATPIGDFYFLSAPGVMSASGPGVYGFLDGPSINGTRQVASYQPASAAGVGLMATAADDVGLFGAYDTSTHAHQVHACTLAAYMDAYTTAANQPWPLSLQACPVVYAGGAEATAIVRVAGGFAVLERGATTQTIRYVPLVVTGTGATQTVSAGPTEVLAEAPNAAVVESMTDYGDDVLLVVRNSLGRTVERAHRQ